MRPAKLMEGAAHARGTVGGGRVRGPGGLVGGLRRIAGTLITGLLLLGAPVVSHAQQKPAPPSEAEEVRGWLGVGLDHEVRCDRDANGRPVAQECEHALLVETVVVGSPADEAGVLPGDTVLAANSREVLTGSGKLDLPSFGAGEEVRLLLGREGNRLTLTVVAGERPGHAAMVPMKVHRRPHPAARPPAAPSVAVEAPTVLAPVPAAGARAEAAEARARMIHDSVLAAAREQLDSVREIRREQMEELHARLREVRRTMSEVERDRREEAVARVERGRERRAEGGAPASRVHRLGGAEFLALHPELARSFPGVEAGLLVLRTVPGTPAAGVGIQPGDVIVEASGMPIARASDLQRALVGHAERDSTMVTWVRGGEVMQGAMRDR